MPRFTYDDTVKVSSSATTELRPGALASVVATSLREERSADFLKRFPIGVVYTIEFEDGSSVHIQEDLVEKGAFPSELS